MIVQDAIAALNPVLPVGRQIGEAMLEHGVVGTRAEARARAIELMRLVGIPSPSGAWTIIRMPSAAACASVL